MRTLWIVALAAGLLAPLAGVPSGSAMPLEVELEDAPECVVGPEGCLASLDTGEDPAPSDDRVLLEPFLASVGVSVSAPGAPTYGASLRPRELVVEHPANALMNDTWLAANDTLPGPLASYVELRSHESQHDALFLAIRYPVPLVTPSGQPLTWSEVPVYTWDCYPVMTGSCSYGSVRPVPNGSQFESSTDGYVAAFAGARLFSCTSPDNSPTQICPALNATHAGGVTATEAWRGATPNVSMHVGVEEVEAQTGNGTALASRAASSGAELGPRASKALPVPDLRQRAPSALVAARDASPTEPVATGGSTALPLGTRAPPSAPQGALASAPPTGVPLRDVVLAATGSLLVLALFLLYHRLTRSHAMENANRQRIVEAIRASPGIRAGTLATTLDLSHGTVTDHLRVLERFGIVEGVGTGQLRYFLAGTVTLAEKRIAVAASAPIARAILEHVMRHGESDFATLCQELGISASTASVTLSRLQKAGVVEKRRHGGRLRFGLAIPVRDAPSAPRGPTA